MLDLSLHSPVLQLVKKHPRLVKVILVLGSFFLALTNFICILNIVSYICLILPFLPLIKTNAQLVYHSCLHKAVCDLDVLPPHEILPIGSASNSGFAGVHNANVPPIFLCVKDRNLTISRIISKTNTGHSMRYYPINSSASP